MAGRVVDGGRAVPGDVNNYCPPVGPSNISGVKGPGLGGTNHGNAGSQGPNSPNTNVRTPGQKGPYR